MFGTCTSKSLPLLYFSPTCLLDHDLHLFSFIVPTVASAYASLDNSMSERMILSGVPLNEPYLRSRLCFMAQQERGKLKEGKLPIDHCYNLLGTADPTGKLGPKEVCLTLYVIAILFCIFAVNWHVPISEYAKIMLLQ